MKRFLYAVVLLLAAWPAWAAEGVKPATLTPEQISNGWILLFDGETTFGWNAVDGGKWTIFNGMLAPQAGVTDPLVTTTAFDEYELKLEYIAKRDSKAEIRVGCDEKGAGGHAHMLRTYNENWADLTLRVRGTSVESSTRSSGFFGGFGSSGRSGPGLNLGRGHIALLGPGVVFRNIKLRPLSTKPIFNGKDLTGWKEFKGDKYTSKFTVNDKGELNVKNGPGDLQTEGQWADFILQLDCISNGKHLNSGIFFRCRPGEYQQGYEAQVRNEFKDEPTQEYTLEEYDPKTGELKDKKKVKYAAVDYGTGAIYRRMPARKQMSKDNEWFTMTIVAHGRHIAVWVNGVQVTDWTDNRPLHDNARNGCRLGKGAISIQGHDPTTDLSFRNFRIAELAPPAAKEKDAPPPEGKKDEKK